MKKILSIILTLVMCISLCSCSCSKQDSVPQQKADFSHTAGVWFESGSPYASKLVMDGTGAVTSYYPENDGVEFEGYLGYDASDDTYSIFTSDDEFISEFTFDSDTQIHIGDDTELIYVKSDEMLTGAVLKYDGAIAFTPTTESATDENGGYYYTYLSEDKTLSAINASFPSTIANDEIIEQYIIRCISDLCESDISNVIIEENIEYTNKIGEHVYIISWKSKEMNWCSFFFDTNTHTYMYTLSAPSNADIRYESVFDGLYLSEE